MASITALLHTENDALRLGRALETLYACDDILIVDHGSSDATVRVAREYGARVVEARSGSSPGDYIRSANPSSTEARWILCLDPHESLSAGQAEEIDRVYRAYPHLNDDAFVAAHRDEWLKN